MADGIFARFARNDDGATSIEYALIAALMATAIAASVTQVGSTLQALLNNVASSFPAGK